MTVLYAANFRGSFVVSEPFVEMDLKRWEIDKISSSGNLGVSLHELFSPASPSSNISEPHAGGASR